MFFAERESMAIVLIAVITYFALVPSPVNYRMIVTENSLHRCKWDRDVELLYLARHRGSRKYDGMRRTFDNIG
jgi:hypothetical protein